MLPLNTEAEVELPASKSSAVLLLYITGDMVEIGQ